MNKRHIPFLLLVIILLLPIAAYSSDLQKTYQATDDLWQRADKLCRSVGELGPTPVFPTTGYEIRKALYRLDIDELDADEKTEYQEILNLLEKSETGFALSSDNTTFDPSVSLNWEAYAFNNLKETYKDEFFIPFKDRLPFLDLDLEARFGNNLQLDFVYQVKDSPMGFQKTETGMKNGDLFYNFHNASFLISPGIDGNWHYLANWSEENTGYNYFNYEPIKAGASFANEYFSFYIGRNRQQFGNGITGNMIIGDNFTYQEFLKFSAYSNIFSYTLSLTHFDNIEFFDISKAGTNGYSTTMNGPHQNRVMHRFEFNILNKVRFAANVGAQLLTESAFDFRMLNPLMIVHNWGNNSEPVEIHHGDEANNILGLELDWAIMNDLSLGTQVAIDQMKVHGEDGSSVPQATGILVNLRYDIPMKTGYDISTYLEFVSTNPYLYLNEKQYSIEYDGNEFIVDNMLDHIVGYGYRQNRSIESSYTGHVFGPDTLAFIIGLDYDVPSLWSVDSSILFKMTGENGASTSYNGKDDTNRPINGKYDTGNPVSGTPEYTLQLLMGGAYNIIDNLKVNLKTATTLQWNYHNEENRFKDSYQASFGISWQIF